MNHHLQHRLRQAWQHRGWLACLLWPLSLLVAGLVRWRRWISQARGTDAGNAPVPVLVVGNVVAGGVGKTPVVMALVDHLRESGRKVGIVSRGYGRRLQTPACVEPSSTAEEVGDEPLLLARHCRVPVAVAPRRMEAIRCLLARAPDVELIVSDDGLQHHAMHHDLAICVFDDRGVGNGWHLPAGPLREAWPRHTVAGVPMFVLNTGQHPRIPGYQAERFLSGVAINGHGETQALTHWKHRPVMALAGIAQPEQFFDMLRQHDVTLHACIALPDHAPIASVLSKLADADGQADVMCTEKDAVKIWPTHPEVWAVPLKTQLPGELLSRIDDWLSTKLSSGHGHQTA